MRTNAVDVTVTVGHAEPVTTTAVVAVMNDLVRIRLPLSPPVKVEVAAYDLVRLVSVIFPDGMVI